MGGTHELVLVDIDEHAVPVPDVPSATAEVISKLETHPNMKIIIGGFRTEVVEPIREALKEFYDTYGRPIYYIAGAATDELIDAENYPFVFRNTPMNSTTLFKQFLFGPIAQIVAPKLAVMYGQPGAVETVILAEDLAWTDGMIAGIQAYAGTAGITVTGVVKPSPTETSFGPIITAIETDHPDTHLVIHIFSAVAGASYIGAYGEKKPDFVTVGINVESQMQEFYAAIGGLCKYESFLASLGTRTAISDYNVGLGCPQPKPLTTTQFWDQYSDKYGHSPIYTAWGCYDTITALNDTFAGWKDLSCDAMIPLIETQFGATGNERLGVLGRFKYTGVNGAGHDMFCSSYCMYPVHDGIVRSWIPQWQEGGGGYGRLEVIFPRSAPFSRKYLTPPWMIEALGGEASLAETDFAGGPEIPTPIDPYKYKSPDRVVDGTDLGSAAALWFKAPPFFLLEADMTNPYEPYGEPAMDHFIDIYDVAKIATDYLKSY